jgi:glyoxylase I family protein
MFKRIDHVEIIPQDFERTLNFYISVFGFKIRQRKKVEMPPMREIVFIELNDTVLELMSVDNPLPPSAEQWQVGYARIALEVEDMDKAVEYLRGKGVEITWGPVSLGTSKRAEIRDPDGLSIELRQW